jgi:chromate reductase
MSQYQIAALIGSLRKESINRKLARAVFKLAPAEFQFNEIQIDDLPLYNQDDEASPAESVKRIRSQIKASHGVIFFTPEYNRSVPGVLKNAIDWASRPYGQSAWDGKPAGIMGASFGAIGTAVAQQHLRSMFGCLNMPTLGQPEVSVQVKEGFFDAAGGIANEDTKKFLQSWMDRYVAWVKRFAN